MRQEAWEGAGSESLPGHVSVKTEPAQSWSLQRPRTNSQTLRKSVTWSDSVVAHKRCLMKRVNIWEKKQLEILSGNAKTELDRTLHIQFYFLIYVYVF